LKRETLGNREIKKKKGWREKERGKRRFDVKKGVEGDGGGGGVVAAFSATNKAKEKRWA